MGVDLKSQLISIKFASFNMKIHLLILVVVLSILASVKCIELLDKDIEEVAKRSWITDWLKKWKDYMTGKAGNPDADKQCKKRKEDGEVPSAELGDSPVRTFGFPYFDVNSHATA